MKTKPKKNFDCVEMKRRGAATVHKMLAGKTKKERLAFWKRQSEILIKLVDEAKRA